MTYYDGTGASTKITSGYTTNAPSIDMSTPGIKTLTVTYNGLTASIDLTVVEKVSYRVTFDLQGHGNELPEYANYKNIQKDSLIAEPSAPSETGYLFKGWYKEASCITLWNFSTDTVTADTTLYAKWEQIIPVQSITLDKTSLILQPGSKASLSATVSPSNTTYPTVIWSSSNEAVATVNDGIVTAVGEGSCSIKATAGSKQASCIVHVNASGTADQIADGSYEGIVWKIDGRGRLTVEGTGNVRANHDSVETIPWYAYRDRILSAEVNVTGMTDAYQLFSGCYNLTAIDLSGFDSGSVTDMSYMFEDCSSLAELDLSKFDTGSVSSMYGMFSGCSSLTKLDLSSFDTRNVTHMFSMFYNCSSLIELDLSNFSTENVVSMSTMFYNCKNLTNLDVSRFNTEKVIDMNYMFTNCSNLNGLDLSTFNTNQVTSMFGMFWGCSNLIYLDISGFRTENVTDMRWMFYSCGRLTSLDVSHFHTGNVIYMSGMFYGCSSLSNLDVSLFDTGKVTDMSSLFYGCNNLTDLDVSHFNTENVTSMHGIFGGCSSLTALDVSNFNTQNVTNMGLAFSDCSGLAELNISSFNTGNVETMQSMFKNCSSLTRLNVSSFNTGNTETMQSMFYSCSSLKALDLSNFDTGKVTDMEAMFQDCSSLTELDASNFHTENVENIGYMFSGCRSLKILNVNNFNTCSVVNAANLFEFCESLEMLDLSSFDMENTERAGSWFWDCSSLVRIQAPVNVGLDIYLPSGDWYDEEGLPVTVLPQNRGSSVTVFKYIEPTIIYPYLTATKEKTSYVCGEILNLDDLTVIYHVDAENEKFITDFTTNASEIDMSEPGHKELKIIYDGRTVNIPLMVRRETEYPIEDTYTVTFNLQDHGTVLSEYEDYKNIKKGELIQKPQDPQEEGYTFAGWYQDEACTIAWDFANDKIEKDLTLYAKWEKVNEKPEDPVEDTYTVTFDLQGHGTALEEYEDYKNIKKGELVQKPQDPQEEGYTFTGWYQDEACTIAWDFANDKVEKDLTLYAKWEKINEKPEDPVEDTYTVTFDLQGHGTALAEYEVYKKIKKGELIQKPQDPQEEGYTFVGWYQDEACTIAWDFANDKIEKDLTLYAKWEKVNEKPEDPVEDTYTVTFDLQGHGTAPAEYGNYKNIKKGEQIQKPQDPQEEGYIFGGWYRDSACTVPWNFGEDKIENDITLYAKWMQEEVKEEDLGEVLPADVPSGGIPKEILWEADIEDVQYTGKAIKPEVHIYWGKERLSEGVDYTLKYRNNVQANEDVDADKAPCVEIKYKKYYPGAENKSIPFKILPVDLDDVTADDIVVACTNKVQKKVPLVTWNGKKLSNKKDISIDYPDDGMPGAYQDVGEYTITISEGRNGNFTGTKDVKLIVTDKVPVSKVSVRIPKQTYQKGTELRPEPIVKYKGKTLEKDSDYTVEYENNTEIGTGSALIIGTGDYIGVKRATFKITGESLKKAKVEKIESKEYDGSFQTPACVVTWQGVPLKEHVDYEVAYSNNRNAGKASVTITGIGAYTGSVKKTFRITAYDLKADEQKGTGKLIKGLEEEIETSRAEFEKGVCKPEPVLTYKGRVLRKGRDYSLSYKNNKKAADVNANKAPTIIIKGKGNFKGTLKKTFTITE